MANMFSGNQEKMIPRSLKKCYEPDPVSHELWGWSQWLETYGKILFYILIGIGAFMTITNAIEMHEIDEALVFSTIIATLIEWGLYAFLEYCAYHILALLIGALATIVQNTRITANVALYRAAKDENYVEEIPAPATRKVVTPTPKPSAPREPSPITTRESNPTFGDPWKCSNCGTTNGTFSLTCKECGKHK